MPWNTPEGKMPRRLSIISALALVALGACADALTAPDMGPNASEDASLSRAAPQPSVARLEVDYMKETINHHLAGIVVAQLCVERVPDPLLHEDPELVELCQTSIASQQRQIALFREWLRDWYGIEYSGEIQPSAEQDIRRLSELYGEEFENEFLTEFSMHHLQIIKRSDKVVRRAFHDPLRGEARMTIVNQSHQVIQMQAWDCEWFGDCRKGLKKQAERFLEEYE